MEERYLQTVDSVGNIAWEAYYANQQQDLGVTGARLPTRHKNDPPYDRCSQERFPQDSPVYTVDTDVVVVAVAAAAKLDIQELWVAFGTAKKCRYIPVHDISLPLGPDKSQALPVFHAYTGCDTVSSFNTQGKKTAWDIWKVFEEVTTIFLALSTGSTEVTCDHVALIERFTILLYNHTINKVNIDEARRELFTMKGRAMDAIPPTRAALLQHIKRAVYQGGHCWGKMVQVTIGMPPPGTGDGSTHKTGDLCGPST